MRNKLILGLGTVAAVLLCFQNCGMNNQQDGTPVNPKLIVTPLADSNISINQGDDLFANSNSRLPSDSGPAASGAPVQNSSSRIPPTALSKLTINSSPSECINGFVPTDYFAARYGFTYLGTGGMFCQLRGTTGQQQIITDVRSLSGTTCPAAFTKIGMLNVDLGRAGIASVSICVKYEALSSANEYISAIYLGIVESNMPALRCKAGDLDGGSIGSTYALCIRR